MAQRVKNPPADAEDVRDVRSIPGSGRSPWRKAWRPTPGFLPGESHGQRSLAGYSPWGRKESVGTERLTLSLYGHSDFALSGSKCSRSVSATVFGFNFDLLARRGN